ncbi:MAG TPA: hypothetical protein VMZ51_04230 [Acidimicrobiales bacterium]|nr:hypothetical protein [Acidimicrobiales bacterium]
MTMIKRLVAAGAVGVMALVLAGPVQAAQPGPGDTQCVPGQNGNPHGGFKAGVCTN